MESTVLELPFDEADGSVVAYDYSPLENHAQVHEGRFIPGRQGNCVYFPGAGYAEVVPQVLDLQNPFTLIMWAQSSGTGLGNGDTYVLVKFAGETDYLRLNLNTNLSLWTHIAFTHHDGTFSTFINAKLVTRKTTPQGWGIATGFCIVQNNGFSGSGRFLIDNYKIISGVAYNTSELIPIISHTTLPVNFYINGNDFKSFGLVVSKTPKGIVDKLPKKRGASYEWVDQHGRHEDLQDARYDAREIELECWFPAVGKDAMMENIMAIKEQFQRDGSQRLMIDLASKPLVYEVHCPGQIEFSDMKWRDGKAFCSFTLNLVENEPVKRVLRYVKANNATPHVSITLSCPELLNIYWGDGQVSKNVHGNDVVATHQYAEPGTYYIIIAGVIEEISALTTNAVIVWNKLQ